MSLTALIAFFFSGSQPRAVTKEETALASAVGRFAQMLGEIERRIVRFPFVLERDGLMLERDARNVFLVEEIGVVEMRMLEFSFGLADEMIDLRRGNTRNLIFDRAQSAGTDRQLSFAAEREQSALAFDLHFARQRRDGDNSVVIFASG